MSKINSVKTAVVSNGPINPFYLENLKNLFSIIDFDDIYVVNDRLPDIPANVELVLNLTAPEQHFEITKALLRSGKHVYSEKPLAATAAEGRELVDLAASLGLKLGCGPDTVLCAGLQTARKLIDIGLIGTVTSCVACINRNQSLNGELFSGITKSHLGAFPYDIGVYYLGALLSLLGPVKSVAGYAVPAPLHPRELLFSAPETDTLQMPGNNLAIGSLEFASGALGSVHFDGNSINQMQNVLTIYGTEGILQLGDPNSCDGSVTLIRPEEEPRLMPFTHGYSGLQAGDAGKPVDPGRHHTGHRGIGAAELAWSIRRDRPARCSGEYGLHCLEILEALEESSRTHQFCRIQSTFTFDPLPSGHYGTLMTNMRADAERSLL